MKTIQVDKFSPSQAFTLVELLVTVGLGILILGTTTQIVLAHLRSTATAERAQRVRDAGNRLNYFLQVEAGEAASVTTNVSVVGQSACLSAPGNRSLFTLNIPLPTGTLVAISTIGNSNLTTTPIHYYVSNGNLLRCGPAIYQNGSLNLDAIVYNESVIASGATLALQICGSTTTDTRAVAYRATFGEATSGSIQTYQPPCEIARAKSFFVVDPP